MPSATSRSFIVMSRMNPKFPEVYGGPDYVKHITNLTCEMWLMKNEEVLCDAEIVVEGKSIPCHKAVLASATEYFRKMFEHNFQENSSGGSKIVIDKDKDLGFTHEIVQSVLFYIYCGVLPYDIDDGLIPQIFVLAHMWMLGNLQQICISSMIKDIGSKNFQQF
eukprot:GFUD01044620.1.p1 GENE.GFUD01044620.1~~GFUD01044620.1.p1  ORF type:complete len:164 (+),score=19.23 GFUD01044620.1:71-562(+)